MKKAWPLLMAVLLIGCGRDNESTPPQSASRTAEPPKSAATPDSRPVIAAFGDSLTAGMGLDPGQGYPEQLQKMLDSRGQAYRVVNLGESGDTTQGRSHASSDGARGEPAIVVLELGANDGLRGLPVANTQTNLAQMIEGLQKSGARVVLAGITLRRITARSTYGSSMRSTRISRRSIA